ncbi:hydroxymethylbilane synthase [Simkania negevensis]|uniref:Hydroxymethylbilane synthase n=1 Tax=Simkania negevensis TaxID=83561 RepID=A0ABS3ATB3_9BACT|nr:hydroxymethylbilane synthase [Simkania negevensis]
MQPLCDVIAVAARPSPLSLVQVEEVREELERCSEHVAFDVVTIETVGDRDRTTSLRTMEKTDFFTHEIDKSLFDGRCRIAIHSAKDLPDPLAIGLQLVALTRGVDSSDVLVLSKGVVESALNDERIVVATSSQRREDVVRESYPRLRFCDVRGNVGERIAQLDAGKFDALVVAMAALIRLGLCEELNTVPLPGETASGQGRLAVVAREGDREMEELFQQIDVR